MKGLLIKDYKLMKNNATFLLGIFIISLVCSAVMENPFFAMGYATALVSIFSVNTIAYDEYDNGMAFLFVLPVDRTQYVKEKYVFALMVTGIGLAASTLIALGVSFFTDKTYPLNEWVGILTMSIFTMIIIQAVLLPVRMKYDSEKHKMAMMIAFGAIFLIGFAIYKLAAIMGVEVEAVLDKVLLLNAWGMLGTVVLASGILLLISYKLAVAFMKKREF